MEDEMDAVASLLRLRAAPRRAREEGAEGRPAPARPARPCGAPAAGAGACAAYRGPAGLRAGGRRVRAPAPGAVAKPHRAPPPPGGAPARVRLPSIEELFAEGGGEAAAAAAAVAADGRRAARAAFAGRLFHKTRATPRGFVTCRLCAAQCWAPNGRYHMDACAAVRAARVGGARRVGGVALPPDAAFARPAVAGARAGKVAGFVVVGGGGGGAGGRKGYVRCLACQRCVWAPNSARHRAACKLAAEPAGARRRGGGDVELHCSETLSE